VSNYSDNTSLRFDARRVSNGLACPQRQDSLDDQIKDLRVLATRFGLYDAGDWLAELIGHRERYYRDYGERPDLGNAEMPLDIPEDA